MPAALWTPSPKTVSSRPVAAQPAPKPAPAPRRGTRAEARTGTEACPPKPVASGEDFNLDDILAEFK